MKTQKPIIVAMFILISSLACNLTADPPATLPPRTPVGLVPDNPTLTPQAPIGPVATVDSPSSGLKPPSSGDGNTAPSLPTSVAAAPSLSSPSFTTQINSVSSDRLMRDVTALVNFGYRHTFSYDEVSFRGIGAARDYIAAEIYTIIDSNPATANRMQFDIHRYSFPYAGQSHDAENLALIMNGYDPNAGIIIIGAHYDTVNDANQANPTLDQPGANDNASGVAAMLEIARIMAQVEHRATIIFVFFSGEELGRYGSRAYLEDYIQNFGLDSRVRVMINLDTIGSSSGPNGITNNSEMRVFSAEPDTSESRQMARMVEFGTRYFLSDIRVNLIPRLDRPGRWGDHQTFSDANIPAIRLIEQEEESLKFHNVRDNLDEIDPTYLRRTTQVALVSMVMLADGPLPPSNISLDTSVWRLEWEPMPGAERYVVAMRRSGSLTFEQEIVTPTNSFAHSMLQNYDVIVIAGIDENGQAGGFSEEFYISNVAFATE